jgi:hypothetical protein
MSRVSHFQRFSQPENHATNNTLLLLRYFYQKSPFKIQNVLNSLLGTDLSIGLTFEQQVKSKVDHSVPDALIKQEPMKIFIETKRGGELDIDQIQRHIDSIERRREGRDSDSLTVLLGLTKDPIGDSIRNELTKKAATRGIRFAAATFSQIAEELRGQCADFDQELRSIVEDYEEFIESETLLEVGNRWLVIFPCGVSIAENKRFDLYYEPPSRPCKHSYRFIGVYDQKSVRYVGAVEAIATVTFSKGKASFAVEEGHLTDAHRTRIMSAVEETPYYNLKGNPHRYYLVDSFTPTDARKVSAGGIWGMRYLDLTKIISGYNSRKKYTSAELAKMLQQATWE